MEAKKNLLTYEGLKALEDELHDLKVVKRKEVAGKIKEAREQGDLSENAEYDAAKDEQRDIEARIEEIEKILKDKNKGSEIILELDGKPHCIAWWDAARDADMAGFAELICIHSLKAGWHQGYGSLMMQQILADVKSAGYAKILLWVFDSNVRAIKFYEAHGFVASGRKQSALGAVEEMYIKEL